MGAAASARGDGSGAHDRRRGRDRRHRARGRRPHARLRHAPLPHRAGTRHRRAPRPGCRSRARRPHAGLGSRRMSTTTICSSRSSTHPAASSRPAPIWTTNRRLRRAGHFPGECASTTTGYVAAALDRRHARRCAHRDRGALPRIGHRSDRAGRPAPVDRPAAALARRRGDDVGAGRPRACAGRSDAGGGRCDLGRRPRSSGAAAGRTRRDRAARGHDERDARPARARAEAPAGVRVGRVPRAAFTRRIHPGAGGSRARPPGRDDRRPNSPRACSPKTSACSVSSKICSCSLAPTSRPCR